MTREDPKKDMDEFEALLSGANPQGMTSNEIRADERRKPESGR